jgi:hypothetical protein
MRIDSIIELRGNDYHVEVNIGRLTPLEQQIISQFGGPDIETGGDINGGEGSASFTLPSRPRRLPDEFPVKFVVSRDDHEDAGLRAHTWKQVMEARITSAKTALLALDPEFVSETRTTI